MSLEIINARLDLVAQLRAARRLREDVTALLRRTHDSQRLVQKFSLGRGDADDLLCLLRTIEATVELADSLEHMEMVVSGSNDTTAGGGLHALKTLSSRLSIDRPKNLATSIAAAIDEEGLMQSHRTEEGDSAEIVALAQNVLHSEGSEEDLTALSGVVRSKATNKAAPTPENDLEDADTWIMRKT